MIDRLIKIGRCCGVEMNVEKTKVMRIWREPSPLQIMIDQKQLYSVEYFNYMGSTKTNNAWCIYGTKFRFAMAKAAFNRKKTLFTRKFDLNLRKKLLQCCIWRLVLYSAETWTLRKVDQKYRDSFEMCCWRKTEIIWTDRVRNEEELHIVKEERNIIHTIKRRKAN